MDPVADQLQDMPERDDALYRSLTAHERFILGVSAIHRNDVTELRLLASICPVFDLPTPDPGYFERLRHFNEIALCTGTLVWKHIAKASSGADVVATRAVAALKGTIAAWEQICCHIGVSPEVFSHLTGYRDGRELSARYPAVRADANVESTWLRMACEKWDGTVQSLEMLHQD